MPYVISLPGSVPRDMENLPRDILGHVRSRLRALQVDPRPGWSERLTSVHPPAWRFRVGGWRIVYEVDDVARTVTVRRVARRDQVYERL